MTEIKKTEGQQVACSTSSEEDCIPYFPTKRDNMEIFNRVKDTDEEAKTTITGGRLAGFTDIRPLWRIKKLTECFGPCGVGWYVDNVRYTIIPPQEGSDTAVMCELEMYVKCEYGWSKPIYGVGGSKIFSKEKGNVFCNDEAYKMAETDAISVACKSLGMSYDVYMGSKGSNDTKYSFDEKKTFWGGRQSPKGNDFFSATRNVQQNKL